ncbi:hypothetical protein ACROAG_08490 [Shewanella oncorhynchi]|uniref:hypothetical protein n=1 Tax=Shewanella oncorhynchi TaxID=2726434 RepID=UPI003D7B2BCB
MTVALCRKSLLLVSLLILSACQQRQAILITQGIEPVKVKAIETALIQSGWQVSQSTIAIPAEFPIRPLPPIPLIAIPKPSLRLKISSKTKVLPNRQSINLPKVSTFSV